MGYYNDNNRNQIADFSEIITKYIGNIDNGVVVDVGAHDGYKWSNSWPLIDAGWTGLLVEPHPQYCNSIHELYKKNDKVTLVESAISNYEGSTELYDGKSLTTIIKDFAEACNDVAWARGHISGKTFNVKVSTIDKVLEENNVKPNFEVFTLDIEGSEKEALEGFDILKWSPKMAIVETLEKKNDHERGTLDMMDGQFYKWCDEYFNTHNYDKVWVDDVNTIYIKK